MHDTQYRTAIAWQNSAYNQPPNPSFFLGTGMKTPPVPNIKYAKPLSTAVIPEKLKVKDLNICPNPVKDKLDININSKSKALELNLVDMEGKLLIKTEGDIHYLNSFINNKIGFYKTGVYVLTVKDGTTLYSSKLLKQ